MFVQRSVDKQFGKESQEIPFGINFIFFNYICPAVIAPDKYCLVTGG
jgi:hypothetical protein